MRRWRRDTIERVEAVSTPLSLGSSAAPPIKAFDTTSRRRSDDFRRVCYHEIIRRVIRADVLVSGLFTECGTAGTDVYVV